MTKRNHTELTTGAAALTVATPLPADRNPAMVYIAALGSPHSRRNYTRYLHDIAGILTGGRADAFSLDWSALRFQHTSAIRARLMDSYAPGSCNVMLSALRGVLKVTWRLGYMNAEDYQRAVDIPSVKGDSLPAGRDLKAGEILALMTACMADDSKAGVRDAAIIGLLYACGLRRAELVGLDISDVEPDSGKLIVRRGKGRKQRTVYASGGALDALLDWLAIRGNETGALFVPISRGDNLQQRRMTEQAVYYMLKKRADEAGVQDFSPHDFRRTFVGDLLERGVDIATVQKMTGHASVETTARYDRRPEMVKQKAAAKLHVPYTRRAKRLS